MTVRETWDRLAAWSQRASIAVLVAIGLSLILFVRAPQVQHGDRVVLTMWQVRGAEEVDPPVPQWFNEDQDAIFVHAVGLPFLEIEQKFLTAAVGNVPPDLFEYFGSVAQWSTRGALMPLDEFMERDGFDRSAIFPALWEEMMWDGRTYAVPTGSANEAFYWNKDHFREAGLDPEKPPATWAELEEYAVRLTTYDDRGNIQRAGYIPGYWSPFPTPLFLNWPVQKGAQFVSEDGTRVMLAEPPNIEALEWEGRLVERLGREALLRKRSSFGFGPQHGFISGQLSMIVHKSSFPEEIEKDGPHLNYGAAPLPIPEGGQPAVIAGSVWIGIPAGARNPDLAWEFIKYYASAPVQARNARFAAEMDLAAFFPANIEAANSSFQQSLPHMDVFVSSMDFARSSTVVPLAHTQFWRAYQTAWDKVMRGSATAREALLEAEREVQRALDEQLAYNLFYADYLDRREDSNSAGRTR